MRVVSVIPKFSAGGIGPVSWYGASALRERTGWDVTLVSLHDAPGVWDIDPKLRRIALGFEEDDAFEFHQWLSLQKPDLVITSDVSRVHQAFRHFPVEVRHIIQLHDGMRRYRDAAVKHAPWIDGVMCVGKHIENVVRPELHDAGFRGILGTVPNGAKFPDLPKPRVEGHRSEIRLLYVGKMDSLLKGLIDIAQILRRLKKAGTPYRLTIVGGDYPPLRKKLQDWELEEGVVWTGRISHEECYQVYADHDIFLMLSRKEPFGMVTIEAMSMGCVPIGYDTPSGTSEIIENGLSGILVPLGDFNAFCAAISDLHGDRQRLQKLSKGGVERARVEYSAERLGAQLESFIEKVVGLPVANRSRRQTGAPCRSVGAATRSSKRIYHRLYPKLRTALRDYVGARPKLARWLLERWNF